MNGGEPTRWHDGMTREALRAELDLFNKSIMVQLRERVAKHLAEKARQANG